MEPTIALFDIDSVLIQPGGYRAGVKDTIGYFCKRMGLPVLAPEDADLELFESMGVSSEWDMVAICLAILLERIFYNSSSELRFESLAEGVGWVNQNSLQIERINYYASIRSLKPYFKPQYFPSEALYLVCRDTAGDCPFPTLVKQPFLAELLNQTRQINISSTTRIFQNFILGNQKFESVYGIPAEIICYPYLKTFDHPLLSIAHRDWLLKSVQRQIVYPVAYTARPCLPPVYTGLFESAYSPEAELALELVGLESIPLIGYGHMYYVSKVFGLSERTLLKPSPFQALAAISTALKRDDGGGFLAALDFVKGNENDSTPIAKPEINWRMNNFPEKFSLHVFEDSPNGIQSAQSAVKLLQNEGKEISLYLWGIGTNLDKIRVLKSLGAEVFEDINRAMDKAFRIQLLL